MASAGSGNPLRGWQGFWGVEQRGIPGGWLGDWQCHLGRWRTGEVPCFHLHSATLAASARPGIEWWLRE